MEVIAGYIGRARHWNPVYVKKTYQDGHPSRSHENIQDNNNTDHKIKQVSLVSKKELQALVRILDRNIKALEEGRIKDTLYSLRTLKNTIENNIREE